MYDYPTQIEAFIKENFNVCLPEDADLKFTSNDLLHFLFSVFPVDCISDYDLNDILIRLNYNRYTYVIESSETDSKSNTETIRKQLCFGWCFKTNHNLTEIVKLKTV